MSVFIGIDVSKNTLDLASYPDDQHVCVSNCPEGFQQILDWLAQHDEITQIALEASGDHGQAVAQFLVDHDYAVSYLNPRQIHAFAQVHLHRHKTDQQDAKLIARYCQIFRPDLYQPPSTLQQHLKQYSRRLRQLEKMQQQEANRLKSKHLAPVIRQQLQQQVNQYERLIEQIHQAIHDLIFSDQTLTERFRLLCSIKGIADKSAQLILAEIDIDSFDSPRQLAAYIGITPRHFQSGTSVHKRPKISKQGNAHLRAGLYMNAVVAKQWNLPCRQLAQRLEKRQKPNMVIIIAVMRKLVHQIYGILKSGQPFDPNYENSA